MQVKLYKVEDNSVGCSYYIWFNDFNLYKSGEGLCSFIVHDSYISYRGISLILNEDTPTDDFNVLKSIEKIDELSKSEIICEIYGIKR
jgi:hypothetical protein